MQYSSDRPCERSSIYHRSLFLLVLLYHFVLPHVKEADYKAIQLIGVIEHKDYFTVGYRATNLYIVSSRFGTPDDFKRLVDQAHGQGLLVFLEIVHSYSATDEMVGLALFD